MTRTDRGEERRRVLEAVRSGAESESVGDDGDSTESVGEPPEPAPDGGTVTLAAPLFHCTACDRTYLEEPGSCDGCGGSSFERRTAE